MPALPRNTLLGLIVLAAAAGCTAPIQKGKSPLQAAQLSPGTVVFDVIFLRFPSGDPEINGALWQEVDEQHLPVEVRTRLAQNGFRAGVIGGALPLPLSKLLALSDKPAETQASVIKLQEAAAPPRLERRHMPLRKGQRGEIIASGVYEQLPVLVRGPNELCGQTYQQAQGIFTVLATPENDGRVRLELLPELHHDQAKQRWVGEHGVLRLEASRPRRTFDDMALTATLKPGDALLMSSLPDRPGSLGHHFFTDRGEHVEQKLLLVRLAQTQHHEMFSGSPPLKLDE